MTALSSLQAAAIQPKHCFNAQLKTTKLRSALLTLMLCCALVPVTKAANSQPVDLVYPYLDSANSRWFFFSSAARPFGMVSLFPDTDIEGEWGSGYRYHSKQIKGFNHIHEWQLAGLSVMPLSSNQKLEQLKTDFQAFYTQSRATLSLECIEDTIVYSLSFENFEKLCNDLQKMERFFLRKSIAGRWFGELFSS